MIFEDIHNRSERLSDSIKKVCLILLQIFFVHLFRKFTDCHSYRRLLTPCFSNQEHIPDWEVSINQIVNKNQRVRTRQKRGNLSR